MRGLIPVKKLDKNGKLVTRHMKPEKVGSSAAWLKALTPKPVSDERERIIRDCGDFLRDDENEIALASLSDKELADVDVIINKIELDSDFKSFRELFNPRRCGYGEKTHVSYALDKLARHNRLDEGISIDRTIGLALGLHRYETLYGGFNDRTNQALIDSSLAVLKQMNSDSSAFLYPDEVDADGGIPDNLGNYYSFFETSPNAGQVWIRNERFVSLIKRRVGEAEEIISIIESRGIIQPEPIEAILDLDSHSSLKAGVL